VSLSGPPPAYAKLVHPRAARSGLGSVLVWVTNSELSGAQKSVAGAFDLGNCFELGRWFPLRVGSQWDYLENGVSTFSNRVEGKSFTPSGETATVVRSSDGSLDEYLLDCRGSRLARTVEADGTTFTFSPPVRMGEPGVPLGTPVAQTGAVDVVIPGVGGATLAYGASAVSEAPSPITVPAGTYAALKATLTLTLVGVGTEVDTFWLARHVGSVRSTASFAGMTDTYELTAASVDTDGDSVNVSLDNCPDIANPSQTDTDGDALGDACDNCTLVPNADQRDTDADGHGNACDPDLNNDGRVTAADYVLLRQKLNKPDPLTDLNGDGVVTAADYVILRGYLNKQPGPSGPLP